MSAVNKPTPWALLESLPPSSCWSYSPSLRLTLSQRRCCVLRRVRALPCRVTPCRGSSSAWRPVGVVDAGRRRATKGRLNYAALIFGGYVRYAVSGPLGCTPRSRLSTSCLMLFSSHTLRSNAVPLRIRTRWRTSLVCGGCPSDIGCCRLPAGSGWSLTTQVVFSRCGTP